MPLEIARFTMGRVSAIFGLIAAYFALPLLLLQAPVEADTHYLETLSNLEENVGSWVEIDRPRYLIRDGNPLLSYFSGAGEVRVVNMDVAAPATVSVRGSVIAADTLRVEEFHVHSNWSRDTASYVGLTLILILWITALVRTSLPFKQGAEGRD